jgi:hypothetical protein
MRSRSASAAATRRRAIRGRAARESRARKRTLLSRPRSPPGPPAPFVAGAPLAAGPPREPLPLALTFACSARTSERTDLALSTRLASRRSTGTSSESWPEPSRFPSASARLGCNGPYPTSASASERTVSCPSGCGRDQPRSPAARRATAARIENCALTRHEGCNYRSGRPAEARRVVDPGRSGSHAGRRAQCRLGRPAALAARVLLVARSASAAARAASHGAVPASYS